MRRVYPMCFLILFTPLLSAQDRASLNGTVTDSTGAVIPVAAVPLQSPDTGLHRETLTNGAGIYEITSLPVGRYVLTIKKPGFKPFETGRIELLFGQTQTIDAMLDVGNVAGTVEVTATPDPLNRSNAEIGG